MGASPPTPVSLNFKLVTQPVLSLIQRNISHSAKRHYDASQSRDVEGRLTENPIQSSEPSYPSSPFILADNLPRQRAARTRHPAASHLALSPPVTAIPTKATKTQETTSRHLEDAMAARRSEREAHCTKAKVGGNTGSHP